MVYSPQGSDHQKLIPRKLGYIREGDAQDRSERKCCGGNDGTGQNGEDDCVQEDSPESGFFLPSWPELYTPIRVRTVRSSP